MRTVLSSSRHRLTRRYLKNKNEFVTREWREKPIEEYTSTIIASNL
jgi:hypothetical protein